MSVKEQIVEGWFIPLILFNFITFILYNYSPEKYFNQYFEGILLLWIFLNSFYTFNVFVVLIRLCYPRFMMSINNEITLF